MALLGLPAPAGHLGTFPGRCCPTESPLPRPFFPFYYDFLLFIPTGRGPKNPELQRVLGEGLLIQKQPEAATEALEASLLLNPNNLQALALLARAYDSLPDKGAAESKPAGKAADPQAPVFDALTLAQSRERRGDSDKAIALYDQLLARRVDPVVVKNHLACLLAENRSTPENLGRAQKLAEESLEINPEDPPLLDTLGWILCRRGKFDQASSLLQKAVDKFPDHPVLQYRLGFCLAKLGDAAPARLALEKALSAKGDFPQAAEAKKLLGSLPPGEKKTGAK